MLCRLPCSSPELPSLQLLPKYDSKSVCDRAAIRPAIKPQVCPLWRAGNGLYPHFLNFEGRFSSSHPFIEPVGHTIVYTTLAESLAMRSSMSAYSSIQMGRRASHVHATRPHEREGRGCRSLSFPTPYIITILCITQTSKSGNKP